MVQALRDRARQALPLESCVWFLVFFLLETIAKPDFTVILNEVKDLKSIKIRDSSLRSE
jgi:hypothetical protein